MDKKMWNPFKILRTKDFLKLKAQDSAFSILVIEDHIESIGKPILLIGGEVLLNGLLALMMLNDMLQSPQPLSHNPHMSQTKSQTRPHRFYPSGATEFI